MAKRPERSGRTDHGEEKADVGARGTEAESTACEEGGDSAGEIAIDI
jgi:hypothetical protein